MTKINLNEISYENLLKLLDKPCILNLKFNRYSSYNDKYKKDGQTCIEIVNNGSFKDKIGYQISKITINEDSSGFFGTTNTKYTFYNTYKSLVEFITSNINEDEYLNPDFGKKCGYTRLPNYQGECNIVLLPERIPGIEHSDNFVLKFFIKFKYCDKLKTLLFTGNDKDTFKVNTNNSFNYDELTRTYRLNITRYKGELTKETYISFKELDKTIPPWLFKLNDKMPIINLNTIISNDEELIKKERCEFDDDYCINEKGEIIKINEKVKSMTRTIGGKINTFLIKNKIMGLLITLLIIIIIVVLIIKNTTKKISKSLINS